MTDVTRRDLCGGTAISTDSEYSHYAWAEQPRTAGGLGPNLRIPLLADRNMRVARDYGCLIEDKGIALRASYLIDPKGVLRQITMNDLPVGRSVDEALRLVQAFQFTVSWFLPKKIFFFFGVIMGTGTDCMGMGDRMNMGKYVRRIGRRVRKRFVRILRPSWSTFLPLMAANKRTARRTGPSARALTN